MRRGPTSRRRCVAGAIGAYGTCTRAPRTKQRPGCDAGYDLRERPGFTVYYSINDAGVTFIVSRLSDEKHRHTLLRMHDLARYQGTIKTFV